MKPTAHLRFLEREEWVDHGASYAAKTVRVLQQWWASDPDDETAFVLQANGEWRDIPWEKEA